MKLNMNLSQRYWQKCQELLDTSIGVAPAYHPILRNRIAKQPDNAYHVLQLLSLTSKICEAVFQILNRLSGPKIKPSNPT
jgi:hypothetical protein